MCSCQKSRRTPRVQEAACTPEHECIRSRVFRGLNRGILCAGFRLRRLKRRRESAGLLVRRSSLGSFQANLPFRPTQHRSSPRRTLLLLGEQRCFPRLPWAVSEPSLSLASPYSRVQPEELPGSACRPGDRRGVLPGSHRQPSARTLRWTFRNRWRHFPEWQRMVPPRRSAG